MIYKHSREITGSLIVLVNQIFIVVAAAAVVLGIFVLYEMATGYNIDITPSSIVL